MSKSDSKSTSKSTSKKRKRRSYPHHCACDRGRPGHRAVFTQMRLAWENTEHDYQLRIVAVDDDGTIHFDDGSVRWNHDPERLRVIIADWGDVATIGAQCVMLIDGGNGQRWAFSVDSEPSECSEGVPLLAELGLLDD